MKMLSVFVLLFASSMWLHAADPDGFGLWKGEIVQNSGKQLASKIDDQKLAFLSLATYQNHLLGIAHREGDGSAELHETQADILIVETGEATLIVGGTMVDPKNIETSRGAGFVNSGWRDQTTCCR